MAQQTCDLPSGSSSSKKQACPMEMITAYFLRGISPWCQETHLCRYTPISLPVRCFFANCKVFWIYLLIFWFFSITPSTYKHTHTHTHIYVYMYIYIYIYIWDDLGGACGNGYRRRKWTRRHEFKSWTRLIAFHIALIPLGKVWIQLFSVQLWVNSRADYVRQPW